MGYLLKNLVVNFPSIVNARSITGLKTKVHKVDRLEKIFLVWTRKYKNLKDVPTFVEQDVMERTRNRMRIQIANCMMLATAVACVVMIYSGKEAARRGESLTKQNLEWHRQFNEEANKKEKLTSK